MLKTNMDLVRTGNNLGQIFASGSIGNWFQPSMTVNSANTLTWTGMATIPLNKLHDFFDKLPTVGSSQGFEIRIQTNIGSANQYSIVVTQAAAITATNTTVPRQAYTVTSVTPTQTVGHTCPFMISPAGYIAGTGLSVSNINGGQAISLSLKSQIGWAGVSGTVPCRIYVPTINYTPLYADHLLKLPDYKVLYNDYYVDTILGIGPSIQTSRLYSCQLSRPRTMYILPLSLIHI